MEKRRENWKGCLGVMAEGGNGALGPVQSLSLSFSLSCTLIAYGARFQLDALHDIAERATRELQIYNRAEQPDTLRLLHCGRAARIIIFLPLYLHTHISS